MKPTYPNDLLLSYQNTESTTPKKVYKIDWENNRLLTRKIGNQEAVSQNLKVMTTVEYQEHEAMPDWFGIAMKDMYGMPKSFVKANMERLIKEAVSPYNIVKRMYDFEIEDIDKYSIGVTCSIELQDGTVFKDLFEVPIDV